MRCCPDEIGDENDMIWFKKWTKVKRPTKKDHAAGRGDNDGTFGDNGVSEQEEWLPVCGTRREFMFHLKEAFDKCIEHHWPIKHDRKSRRREERAFLHQPAFPDACPDKCKDTAHIHSDFSSVLHTVREHDKTCSCPESHNCNVVHVTHSPCVQTVDSLAEQHPRTAKKLAERGVTGRVKTKGVAFFGYSKDSGSAACDQAMLEDVISTMKHGRLSENSRAEAFVDRRRMPGSFARDDNNDPLPEGLLEWNDRSSNNNSNDDSDDNSSNASSSNNQSNNDAGKPEDVKEWPLFPTMRRI